jgi:VanZ family protein
MFFRHNQFSVLFFVVIFLLCLLPGSEVPKSGQEHLDKFVHAILFGLFSFCTMIGFTKQYQFSVSSSRVVLITVFFSILYGVFIELFQGFILTDRSFEWLDLFADATGVLIGYLAFKIVVGKECRSH